MSFPTPANAFGLFDMAGNVWEWNGDCHGACGATAAVDPTGPTGSCTVRVFRGGDWRITVPANVRAAVRQGTYPSDQGYDVGFRCARSLSRSAASALSPFHCRRASGRCVVVGEHQRKCRGLSPLAQR